MAGSVTLLAQAVDSYIAFRRAAGFRFRTQADILRSFMRHAIACGDAHVRTATAVRWAIETGSIHHRASRLDVVRGFATYARAEDARHEVPPASALARPRYRRPRPYIYASKDIAALLDAALALSPRASLRPMTYYTLIGLLASTGLRISEALKLTSEDITADGLRIRETKYKKSRIIPVHDTVAAKLEHYQRRRSLFFPGTEGPLLVNNEGRPLTASVVQPVFRGLVVEVGLGGLRGGKTPRLHDLRHTWTVRALEHCQGSDEVAIHSRAVSTYLGHVKLASNYWYQTATPHLMTTIADACEQVEKLG